MLRYVTPHLQLTNILELDAATLRERGVDGLLLDLDNTLKDHGVHGFRPEIVEWVRKQRAEGIKLCLLSNGRPARVGSLADVLGVDFVGLAFKPFPFGCRAGLRRLGLPAARTAIVGDQVFADVLAGRLAGLFTILVRPSSAEEPWFTRVKRPLERRVLDHLNRPAGRLALSPRT
jgi:HAD superfamily phosphatase (TIGR01668 family)